MPFVVPAARRTLRFSWATTIAPSFWKFAFHPVWSPWKWVLMTYLIGKGDMVRIAALILSESGENWVSTMIIPSSPTATVMLPPTPSSMQVLLPRSGILICTEEQWGGTTVAAAVVVWVGGDFAGPG